MKQRPDWQALTRQVAHRPWPLPRRPWIMTMSWLDLLFAHWPMAPEELRRRIPPSLELDLFAGQTWLGIVPFRMENVGVRGLGWLPSWLLGPRSFPELNVRTYVRCEGKPGVFFFSLDAADALAVAFAQWTFHLPYFKARMWTTRRDEDGWVDYSSVRTDPRLGAGDFVARYCPVGDRLDVVPGSLEHWLIERYCLYAVDRRGRAYRGEIHHAPWPLYAAKAEIEKNTVVDSHDLTLTGKPLLHFASRLDVVGWWLAETAAEG